MAKDSMENFKGNVYWITGLSGAGKTTFGKILYQKLKSKTEKVIFLDGDELRKGVCNDLGYSDIDRRKCALRYSQLCGMLSKQGFHVICCTISMYNDIYQKNRKNIDNYCEIYIKTPLNIIYKRNSKLLYGSDKSKTTNVVGLDIKYDEPKEADYIIQTDRLTELYIIADIILKKDT